MTLTMCGIGGILSKGNQEVPIQALAKMSQALAHRGPDDSGHYFSADHRIGLVHRRLSIIDLSPEARQPMADSSGKNQIVYNGEIYNFKDLRTELERKGTQFHTSSDTEVILALYTTLGENLLAKLRGMFAFALWDSQQQTLFLARDRFGIKPLYYANTQDYFLFASEIRAILSTGLVEKQICVEALAGYLSFGSVPSPFTTVSEIKSLPPAYSARVSRGELREKRYWNFSFESGTNSSDTRDALLHHLTDAVKSHLVSDVPVGIFLSGGIDSTAVAALMRSVSAEKIQSLSISFPGSPLDEAKFSRLASQTFETEHSEQAVSSVDFEHALPDILEAMDQPTLDGVNTYFVSRLARASGVKVVLSGLGGDELFGGYPSFRLVPQLLRWYSWAEKLPLGKTTAQALLGLAPEHGRIQSIAEFFRQGGTLQAGYFAVRRLFLQSETARLLTPETFNQAMRAFTPLEYLHGLFRNGKIVDPQIATTLMEMRGYMHNQLLRDTDVMAMAHGVEVRVPFLDHPLVERVSLIPAWQKFGAQPKQLLLSALKGKIPSAIYKRPKMGFTFPFAAWLRGSLRATLESSFAQGPNEIMRSFWNWEEVRKVWDLFLDHRIHWSRPWSIFVLNEWMRLNLE